MTLPPISPTDHPEHHSMMWTELEIAWVRDYAQAAVLAERERCALIAVNGRLVPPDGGSPTDDERLLCEEIARRIRDA